MFTMYTFLPLLCASTKKRYEDITWVINQSITQSINQLTVKLDPSASTASEVRTSSKHFSTVLLGTLSPKNTTSGIRVIL